MLKELKQSGARVTDSFRKKFNRSIIRLTLIYAGTLAVILIISGIVLYSAFSNRIGRRFNAFPPPPPGTTREIILINQPTAADLRHDLVESIVLVNGLLLVLAGISSYWLAARTLQPIKDAYERQQRFLGDASHELRTPLAILHIELENELGELKKESDREAAQSKLDEVKRMTKLVNDLLILSRLDDESPETDTRIKLTSLLESLSPIVDRLQTLAQAQEIGLSLTPFEDFSLPLDTERFSHAVTNFIQNAIVYNRPHGTVTVSVFKKKKEALVTISDTGIGIAQKDLENIFERFYRTDKSRSRQTGGSGLGLSIAYSALKQMGGDVKMESALGTGTTVTVSLPLS